MPKRSGLFVSKKGRCAWFFSKQVKSWSKLSYNIIYIIYIIYIYTYAYIFIIHIHTYIWTYEHTYIFWRYFTVHINTQEGTTRARVTLNTFLRSNHQPSWHKQKCSAAESEWLEFWNHDSRWSLTWERIRKLGCAKSHLEESRSTPCDVLLNEHDVDLHCYCAILYMLFLFWPGRYQPSACVCSWIALCAQHDPQIEKNIQMNKWQIGWTIPACGQCIASVPKTFFGNKVILLKSVTDQILTYRLCLTCRTLLVPGERTAGCCWSFTQPAQLKQHLILLDVGSVFRPRCSYACAEDETSGGRRASFISFAADCSFDMFWCAQDSASPGSLPLCIMDARCKKVSVCVHLFPFMLSLNVQTSIGYMRDERRAPWRIAASVLSVCVCACACALVVG